MAEQVLLINLPFSYNKEHVFHEVKDYEEHLGIESLAAVLRRNGYTVKLIDAQINKMSKTEILKEIISKDYQLVGFSIFSFSYYILQYLCKEIKRENKDIHLTVGGHFSNGAYRELLQNIPELDSVNQGEGEETLLELVRCVLEKKEWRHIKGICYKEKLQIIKNPNRELITDLDALPFPDRDFLDEKKQQGKKIRTINIYSSRGCYGTCNFCSIKAFYQSEGPVWRSRSAANVVDELEILQNKYNPQLFMFVDDNFMGFGNRGRKRALDIANEIIRRNLKIRFMISCRVNDVEPKLFELLIRAGLIEVFLGVENFCDDELKFFNKGTSCTQNCKAISYLQSKNICVSPGFIMFTPYTTIPNVLKNIEYLQQYNLLDSAVKFNFLGRVLGSSFDKLDTVGLFKKDYDVLKNSLIYRRSFNIFDKNVDELITYMECDHWVGKSMCVDEYLQRLENTRMPQNLNIYLFKMIGRMLRKKSFSEDIKYIKDLCQLILYRKNEDEVEQKIKETREKWKDKNKEIRKCFTLINKAIKEKNNMIWNFKFNSKLEIEQENGTYCYVLKKDNTFIKLTNDGHKNIQYICNGKSKSVNDILQFLLTNHRETNEFLTFFFERDIIEIVDDSIGILKNEKIFQ